MSKRTYGMADNINRNLTELDRRYRFIQMKAAAQHGVIIGIIIFLFIKISEMI